MLPFRGIFPDVAARETRSLTCFGEGTVPADEYAFDECYCVDPKCDCRRTTLMVYARNHREHVATISHSFEPPAKEWNSGDAQTFLDPLHKHASFAPALLKLFVERVLEKEYAERLVRHYRMVKDALADRTHPIHAMLKQERASLAGNRVIQPNERCPCGSGKKFKKCCGATGGILGF